MLAKAAVLCGKNTIQVRELELPPIGDDELLVKNISNSICLSTYKAALLGRITSVYRIISASVRRLPVMSLQA